MIGYDVDFSDVKVFVNRMRWEGDAALALFFVEAEQAVQDAIVETILQVSSTAGDGFPPDYADHLIEQVESNPPIIKVGGGLEVDFNLLGTYDDYRKGFHRHAIGANNERIELPYMGQSLKNEEIEVRQTYWEDKVVGYTLYNATIYDRVDTWKSLGVAPEWWVLQNGSDSEPFVTPTPLAELTSARVTRRLEILMNWAMQEAVDKAEGGFGVKPGGELFYNVRDRQAHFPQRWSKR